MKSTIYCFAVDLVGEGVQGVCDRAREAGLSGITLAGSYHESRDYLPHNPLAKVHYSPPGTAFIADASLYPAELSPAPLLPVCNGRDVLADLLDEAGDLDVHVWAVYLHNDGPSGQHGAVRNAFGDEHQGLLCPANLVVRQYAVALTRDLARPGVRSVSAEALHGLPFEHGFHHERRFAPLTRLERFLLSLCFCAECAWGAAELAERVRGLIGSGADVDGEWSELAVEEAVPGVAAHLERRAAAVASLVAECTEAAAAAGVEFAFLDVSAGIEGWASGEPTGPLGVDVGWELGVDVSRFGPETRVIAVPYARDPDRVREEVAAYRSRAVGPIDVILRPMEPDCDGPANLTEKLTATRGLGVDRVAYYHYAMMPLGALDTIASASI